MTKSPQPNEPTRVPIRVIIIDPYPLSRYGLTALLRSQGDVVVVRAGASLRTLQRSVPADLVVVQTDGSTEPAQPPEPTVVEVSLRDSPSRVLAAIRHVGRDRPVTALAAQPHLTPREVEVVALVADGLTDYEIADALYLSVRTVRSHLDRIRAKTGMRRRVDLTRWYLQENGKE